MRTPTASRWVTDSSGSATRVNSVCGNPTSELISRGAEMEAHIDDVSLGTNTKEDHVLLLREFFIVCQENHLRIKLEKCEFMKEEM